MKRDCALAVCMVALTVTSASNAARPQWLTVPFREVSVLAPIEETLPPNNFVDLDKYPLEELGVEPYASGDEWVWQVLPHGLVYGSYLAGTKESRFSGNFINVKGDGWLFDTTLGGRVGLLRHGTIDGPFPEGIQIDAEGSAQMRLDIPENVDVRSVDYRAGLPLTFGVGSRRWKIAYYHLSSHLGDEFLLSHPGFPRLNFVRDVLVFGHMIYVTPQVRIYGEAGWAFNKDVSEPWEFQFGVDYAPPGPTGIRGAPFFALNGHLREEVDFGGSLTAQAGWAWRSDFGTPLLRAGIHYFNGKSNQFSFYNEHEQQIGLAAWYDY